MTTPTDTKSDTPTEAGPEPASETAYCFHLRVVYDPVRHEDGTISERWVCSGMCGQEFVRRAENESLRAEVERLREALGRIRRRCHLPPDTPAGDIADHLDAVVESYDGAAKKAEAEVERLKAALRGLRAEASNVMPTEWWRIVSDHVKAALAPWKGAGDE